MVKFLVAIFCASMFDPSIAFAESWWYFDARAHSSTPRLSVLMPGQRFHVHASHGLGSDRGITGHAHTYSNRQGSHATSAGLYLISERYYGANGRSYRLDGLSPGHNDRARVRNVVIHPARYVTGDRAGVSHGCVALNHQRMMDLEKAGSFDNAVLYIDSGDWAPALAPCGVTR